MHALTSLFKALSDANRIRIVKMLEIRSLCACEIVEVLQLANSTVSKHLAILRESGLISDKKEGKWVNYALNKLSADKYVPMLLSLLPLCLPDDQQILQDAEKIKSVNRDEICKKQTQT